MICHPTLRARHLCARRSTAIGARTKDVTGAYRTKKTPLSMGGTFARRIQMEVTHLLTEQFALTRDYSFHFLSFDPPHSPSGGKETRR